MMPVLLLVVAVVVVSVVVGAIAQFLNKLNEAAAPPPRPNGPRPANPAAGKDMDRFLAEIDRLRRKAAAEAGGEQPPPKPAAPRAEPVGRAAPVAPARDAERDREQRRRDRDRERDRGRSKPAPKPAPAPAPSPSRRIEQPPPPAPLPSRPEDLPVAAVATAPPGTTGAPAPTRVTKLAGRPRAAAKSDFAKNLTALLASGQGAAAAVVLGEIFGPPKSRRSGGS